MALNLPPQKTNKIKLLFFVSLALTGIVFVSAATYIRYSKRILSFNKVPQAVSLDEDNAANHPSPAKISFPGQKLDLPVVSANITNGTWEISDNSASFLSTSAKPGQDGNIVIYGHNKKAIFGPLLGRVKIDDIVEIETEDGSTHKYKVFSVFEVTPDKVEVVGPESFEILTVYTCTGLLDSKRLIIQALPYSES